MRRNLSIHLGFYLQLPSRPISLSLSHRRALKSTRVRFRPPAICLCQAFISSLVPPFGNSKGELNTVCRPHLPLPSLLLPFCPFSVYCSTWNRTVIFTLQWIKGDSLPVFSPSCAQIWYFFPRRSIKAKKRTRSFLFFYPRFVWKGEMQNAIMRSVAWNGGSAWLTLFVENMISLGLFSQAIYVVCVVWSLFLSLPALFIYSLLYVRGHTITEALRMWGSLYKWNWVVSMFGWGSKYWNKYLLGSLATLSIETQLNRCWESEIYTKPLKAD